MGSHPPLPPVGTSSPPQKLSSPAWHRDKVPGTGGVTQQRGGRVGTSWSLGTALPPPASPSRHSPHGRAGSGGRPGGFTPPGSRTPTGLALMSC